MITYLQCMLIAVQVLMVGATKKMLPFANFYPNVENNVERLTTTPMYVQIDVENVTLTNVSIHYV